MDNRNNPYFIKEKLLDIFNQSKHISDNYTSETNVIYLKEPIYETIIKNNDDICCIVSTYKRKEQFVLSIEFIMKCSIERGNGNKIVENIIAFCRLYHYDEIQLTNSADLDFTFDDNSHAKINLTDLKLLINGNTWYSQFGFNNPVSLHNQPILEEYIHNNFTNLIEKFNSFIYSNPNIDENIKQKLHNTPVYDIVERFIDSFNLKCGTHYTLETHIREFFINLQKCIFANRHFTHFRNSILQTQQFLNYILFMIFSTDPNLQFNMKSHKLIFDINKILGHIHNSYSKLYLFLHNDNLENSVPKGGNAIYKKRKISKKNINNIYKMVKTRSMTKTRKQVYRSRVKKSHCRGKNYTACRHKNGCTRTMSGKRKSYCRKLTNRHA
jgi:hypothetical protein